MKVSLVSNLSEIYVPYLADACTSMPIQEERVRKAIIIAIPQIYHEFSDFHIMLLHSKNKPSQVGAGRGGHDRDKRSLSFLQDFLLGWTLKKIETSLVNCNPFVIFQKII